MSSEPSQNTPHSEATGDYSNHGQNTPKDDIKYDDAMQAMATQASQAEEEERDRIKQQEEKLERRINRIAKLKEKDPPNAYSWCIGDSPCFMFILQFFVLSICCISLLFTYLQREITADHVCDDIYGPYYGYKDNQSYGCGWPQNNIIIRCVAPGLGFLLSFVMLVITVSWGRKLYKSIDVYNKLHFPNQEDKGAEYYEIYNVWYFKLIRRLFSGAAYLQLVSFGFDLAQYLVGKENADSQNLSAPGSEESEVWYSKYKYNFQLPLIMGLSVALILRFAHDAIWISWKKRSIKFQIAVLSDTTYTTTAHVKADTVVAYIDPNVSAVDPNERHLHGALSYANGHVLSASSYAGDHSKAPTVIYVNTTTAA